MQSMRRSGFTLIEISVVLVIALIISSITFGAFRSVTDGNKRTNCQSNLSQIYQSCRLYAQDYSGEFPYFNEGGAPVGTKTPDDTPAGGIGLWSLYSFRKANDSNCDSENPDLSLAPDEAQGAAAAPPTTLASYVRSPKIFHCPADSYKRTIKYRATPTATGCVTQAAKVLSSDITFVTDGSAPSTPERRLNPAYLSYQGLDEVNNDPSGTTKDVIYSSFRQSGQKRQLINFVTVSSVTETPERPSSDNTVVAWCRFHRSLNADVTTGVVTTKPASRNYDNVLFYDGTVQNLPSLEDPATSLGCPIGSPPSATCVASWLRVPKIRP